MKIVNGIVSESEEFKIIQDLIPAANKNARPGVKMTAEYITIHNTGNKGTSAAANSNYVDNQNGYVSWHFTVGPREVYQELPITEHAWHAGDGATGTGNTRSIGIEIAEVNGAEQTAVKFIAQLLIATGMTIDNVVPHQHWSGKYCPRLILPHWDKFIANIKNEMDYVAITEAKEIIKAKAGLDNNTLAYLENYKYGDALLTKLANAMK